MATRPVGPEHLRTRCIIIHDVLTTLAYSQRALFAADAAGSGVTGSCHGIVSVAV